MKTILRLSMMIGMPVIIAVMISGCGGGNRDSNKEVSAIDTTAQVRDTVPSEPFTIKLSAKTLAAIDLTIDALAPPSDLLTLDAASEIGSVLIDRVQTLSAISTTLGFGGTFDKIHFEKKDAMRAVKLWYCYNPDNSDYPKLFLALEQIEKFESGDKPEDPPKNDCAVPSTFLYDGASPSHEDVKKFMRNTTKDVAPVKKTIEPETVLEFSKNFKNLVGLHCKYPVAIFHFNAPYDIFVKQKSKNVRYFFGYAADPDYHPNYIRTILAGIDANGKLINDEPEMTNGETAGILLQKSVPPPPITKK
jgi:hypothetical protein